MVEINDVRAVKNLRLEDGVYEFRFGDKMVKAVRLPDLYFVIELDGVKHKGYLKDLKLKFLVWAQGGAVEAMPAKRPRGPAPEPEAPAAAGSTAVREVVEEAVEEEPETTFEEPRYKTPRPPPTAPWEVREQWRIDNADSRFEQVRIWVACYNAETTMMEKEKRMQRRVITLPPGPKPSPSLPATYNPAKDRYLWPNRYEAGKMT
jgi:hypothetical protein